MSGGMDQVIIPFGARILAVADAFEAVRVPEICDRSVRNHIALRILRVASGTQFDPSIVDILVELMGATKIICSRVAYR